MVENYLVSLSSVAPGFSPISLPDASMNMGAGLKPEARGRFVSPGLKSRAI
jgi:hypothetical protein